MSSFEREYHDINSERRLEKPRGCGFHNMTTASSFPRAEAEEPGTTPSKSTPADISFFAVEIHKAGLEFAAASVT